METVSYLMNNLNIDETQTSGGIEFQNILFKVFSNFNIKHSIIN